MSKLINKIKNKISYKMREIMWSVYLSQYSLSTLDLIQKSTENYTFSFSLKNSRNIEYLQMNADNIEDIFKISEFPSEPRFISVLPNCEMFGALAIPFHDGKIVLEPFGGTTKSFVNIRGNIVSIDYYNNKLTLPQAMGRSIVGSFFYKKYEKRKISSSYVFPLVHFYKSYYHWIMDYLPKLRALKIYEKRTGNKPDILIRPDTESFRIETLSLLGYPEDRIIRWTNKPTQVKNLILTQHRHSSNEYLYSDCKWLKNEFLMKANATDSDDENNVKIFVSRQSNDTRRVINFKKLKEEIVSRGFQIVTAESLSVLEQVRLFNSADIIMAPHGAGLTNMVFSDEPTIIEIFPETNMPLMYKNLAELLGFEYYSIVAESQGNHNIHVDLSELSKLLDQIPVNC